MFEELEKKSNSLGIEHLGIRNIFKIIVLRKNYVKTNC